MRKVDKLIVLDVEATCWEDKTLPASMLPRRDESEIIEVGVCTLNLDTLAIEDVRSIIVKPEKTEVSDFCTQLTGITQAQVDAIHPCRASLAAACMTAAAWAAR